MSKSDDGFVKYSRSITEHWLYQEKRKFSMFEAWFDLIMMVNYKDVKTLQDGVLVVVKRGERITSIRKLMARWDWSNTKVVKFLELLESDGMIEVNITPQKKTLIKVVNYEARQGFVRDADSEKKTPPFLVEEKKPEKNDTKKTEENQSYQGFEGNDDFEKRHKKDREKTQNNISKEKKRNKDIDIDIPKDEKPKDEKPKPKNRKAKEPKIEFAEFVNMTKTEYEKLVNTHGEDATKKMIDMLDNYKGAKGKTYASDYRAILSWVIGAYQKAQLEIAPKNRMDEINKLRMELEENGRQTNIVDHPLNNHVLPKLESGRYKSNA